MMNIKRQSQFELFPGAIEVAPESNSRGLFLKNLTLTPENIIVLAIIFLLGAVLFFAFGVEQGKRSQRQFLERVATKNGTLGNKVPPKIEGQSQRIQSRSGTPQAQQPLKSLSGTNISEPVNVMERKAVPASAPTTITDIATTNATTENQYTIQVASFKSKDSAEKEASILKKIGYEIYILTKGSHAIVCVGKFAGQDEAKKFSRRLKNRYTDCLVRRF